MAKQLQSIIVEEISHSPGKVIPFVRFMELALYHPHHGYYMTEKTKVGKEGDFYTSVSVHPVFAETLADAIIPLLSSMAAPVLVEIGGGSGQLIKQICERMKKVAHELYQRLELVMVETSPYHRKLQQAALAEHQLPQTWYESVMQAAAHRSVTGVILSNEWFDAFPVHLLERRKTGWIELGVSWDGEQFYEQPLPEVTSEAQAFLKQAPLDHLPIGMRIEWNSGMADAVAQLGALLEQGFVITIDYGDTAEGLYHPSRNRGTLMCYWRHQHSENPYIRVGEQDITAHVNFTALMEWGKQHGLEPLWFSRQGEFLLKAGILNKLQEHQDTDPFTSEAMKRNRAIRQLISAEGMGHVFRVLIQQKGESELAKMWQ